MRTLRLFVGLVAVGSLSAAIVTGCGNDDTPAVEPGADSGTGGGGDSGGGGSDTGTQPGTDGSTPGKEAGVDSAVTPVITASATDLNVYIGQTALPTVTATVAPSVPLTYVWTVTSAPTDSTITTPSLFNSGSAAPSFQPDVPGAYVLKVTITAEGATAVEQTVTVNAFEASAIYRYWAGDGGPGDKLGLRARGTVSDAAPHDSSCTAWDAGNGQLYGSSLAVYGVDLWEAPPGADSRAAYVEVDRLGDAAVGYALLAVTSSSTCAAPPTRLDSAGAGSLMLQPRFSPDGQRVVYIYQVGTTADRIVTIGFDGMTRHVVAPSQARPDGGPFPDASAGAGAGKLFSPRWQSATKVGWLELTSGGGWQIVTADDTDSATPDLYMACAAANANEMPAEFTFLPDGSILVAQRVKYNDSGSVAGSRDLLVMQPNATTKKCELVRNLTTLESDGGTRGTSNVSDFSLSPDGTQVAYVAFDHTLDAAGGPEAYSVWTAPVNGFTPPARVPHTPKFGAQQLTAPRWAAGGALLFWPQDPRTVDAGAVASSAMVVTTVSGTTRLLDKPAVGRQLYGAGNGYACSIAAAGGSGIVGLGATAAFVGLLIRRRRRAK